MNNKKNTKILSQEGYKHIERITLTSVIEMSSPQKIYKDYLTNNNVIYANGEKDIQILEIHKTNNIIESLVKVDVSKKAEIIAWTKKNGLLCVSDNTDNQFPVMSLDDFSLHQNNIKTIYELLCAIHDAIFLNNIKCLSQMVTLTTAENFLSNKEILATIPDYYLVPSWGKTKKDIVHIDKQKNIVLINNLFIGQIEPPKLPKNELLSWIATWGISSILHKLIAPGFIFHMSLPSTSENENNIGYTITPTIKCTNLATMLYFKLLWIICENYSLRRCINCQTPFMPDIGENKRPGGRKYCNDCGHRGIRSKYKKERNLACKLKKEGKSIEAILETLGRTPTDKHKIAKWVAHIN